VFPPNRLLLIFEAKEIVLFFFFFSHPIILQSIEWSMMHRRALKRIEKKKKICVQYRLIVFLSYFFLSFSSRVSYILLNDKRTYTQTVFYFLFFLTWEPDLVYKGNISFFVLILSRGMHQPTLDQIFFIPSSSSG